MGPKYVLAHIGLPLGRKPIVESHIEAIKVRKSHCHVFLGVLDPGQAPPKPWKVMKHNRELF